MPRLLSVNVGLPRDIEWRGRTVHTAVWKTPVQGRRRVRRLKVDGDGQGDLAGHGGEQRAVLVYQVESYCSWEERLGRRDLAFGQFGENFTVEGLPDDEVCIGDRYRIGTALFEVTQPRTTCYRIGIRMDEPRMAALLYRVSVKLEPLGVPREGDFYLCGPPTFLAELTAGMVAWGVPQDRLRDLRRGPLEDAGRGRWPCPGPASACRSAGNRPAGLLRAERPRRPVPPLAGPEPPRAGRGVRRARSLVLPERRLPQLRERTDLRFRRLRPRPARPAGRRKRPHLLLPADG